MNTRKVPPPLCLATCLRGLGHLPLLFLGVLATVPTAVLAQDELDLVVTISGSVDPVVAGSSPDNLTYIVSVTNDGPSDATGVSAINNLRTPPFVTLSSITPSAGTTFAGSNWNIGDLAAGASATLTSVVNVGELAPASSTTISNFTAITAVDQFDFNPANNLLTIFTSIANEVDIAMSQSVSSEPVIAGSGSGNLVYVVTANNSGPSGARNAIIQEALTLPAGVTIDSIVPSLGSYMPANAPDGDWTLTLPPGDSATLTITLTVAADAPLDEMIVNTATFGSLQGTDTNAANDSATEETNIVAQGPALKRITALPNRDILLEFSSIPGNEYIIQHSPNGIDWFDVDPIVPAGGTRTQWIDDGPPKTPTHPTASPTRLYRVVGNTD